MDAQEAYLRAMADELRKTLDIQAFTLASRQAHTNSAGNVVEFNMQGAVGEAETNRIQIISRYIDKVGTRIYDKLFRGGVSVIFGGPLATGVLTGHNRWNDTGAQDANGIYKLGNIGDIPVFRVPTEVCPNEDLVCVYKNRQLPEDVFLIIGTLLPLHVTDKLEFPGLADLFGDWIPDEWIQEVFKACKAAPQHRYLFLTKNPKRYIDLLPLKDILDADNYWFGFSLTKPTQEYHGVLGVKNLFISIEPIQDSFGNIYFDGVKWVIIGAETVNRNGKVIPKREWIENIVENCRGAGVPVFLKDNLASVWGEPLIQEYLWKENGNGKDSN